jgi:hypothetical protein
MGTKTEISLAELKIEMEQNKADHREIKEEMCEIKGSIKEIGNKIDKVIDIKADKTEVKDINTRMWALLAGIVIALFGAFMSLLSSYGGVK